MSAARTFILNYYRGEADAGAEFDKIETAPKICKSGGTDEDWEQLRTNKKIWKDGKLENAGREFAARVAAQRKAFQGKRRERLIFRRRRSTTRCCLPGLMWRAF